MNGTPFKLFNMKTLLQLGVIQQTFFGSSVVDGTNLVDAWSASSITSVNDGQAVSTWVGNQGVLTFTQATESSMPIFRSNIDGKAALEFSDNHMKTAAYTCTAEQTVYILFRVTVSPTSVSSMVTQDEAGTSSGRSWHSKFTNTGAAQAVSFNNTTGQSDTTTNTVSVNTWQVHVNRRSAVDIEAFINTTSNGPTTISAPNIVTQPITVGKRGVLSEPYSGYIAGIRVYKANHDATTREAVIAEMMN